MSRLTELLHETNGIVPFDSSNFNYTYSNCSLEELLDLMDVPALESALELALVNYQSVATALESGNLDVLQKISLESLGVWDHSVEGLEVSQEDFVDGFMTKLGALVLSILAAIILFLIAKRKLATVKDNISKNISNILAKPKDDISKIDRLSKLVGGAMLDRIVVSRESFNISPSLKDPFTVDLKNLVDAISNINSTTRFSDLPIGPITKFYDETFISFDRAIAVLESFDSYFKPQHYYTLGLNPKEYIDGKYENLFEPILKFVVEDDLELVKLNKVKFKEAIKINTIANDKFIDLNSKIKKGDSKPKDLIVELIVDLEFNNLLVEFQQVTDSLIGICGGFNKGYDSFMKSIVDGVSVDKDAFVNGMFATPMSKVTAIKSIVDRYTDKTTTSEGIIGLSSYREAYYKAKDSKSFDVVNSTITTTEKTQAQIRGLISAISNSKIDSKFSELVGIRSGDIKDPGFVGLLDTMEDIKKVVEGMQTVLASMGVTKNLLKEYSDTKGRTDKALYEDNELIRLNFGRIFDATTINLRVYKKAVELIVKNIGIYSKVNSELKYVEKVVVSKVVTPGDVSKLPTTGGNTLTDVYNVFKRKGDIYIKLTNALRNNSYIN